MGCPPEGEAMTHKRPVKWNMPLLNALVEVTGTNHQTIRTNVKHLSKALNLELPKVHVLAEPTPYCLAHKIDLNPSMLETKQCEPKQCVHLVHVKKIVKW